MNKIIFCFVLFLIFSNCCFGLEYPNDYYFKNLKNNTNIVLGTPISYFEKNYGNPKEITTIWKYESNYFELWKYSYDDFYVFTDSNTKMLRYFSTSNSNYETSKKIKCGDNIDCVIEQYGTPTYKTENLIMYVHFFQEINLPSETTILGFVFDEKGSITRIYMTIDFAV